MPDTTADKIRKLLEGATKGEWRPGRLDMRSYLGDRTPVHYIYRGDAEDHETRIQIVPMKGSSADPTDDAVLIVSAVNLLPELAAVVEAAERLPVIHDRRCRHHWFAPTSCDCGAADDRQELDKALAALASKMKENERAN